jgi:hypothetical protein
MDVERNAGTQVLHREVNNYVRTLQGLFRRSSRIVVTCLGCCSLQVEVLATGHSRVSTLRSNLLAEATTFLTNRLA